MQRVLVSATDISRDRTLHEQIRSLAMMPETNPNVVLMMECDANITYANPTARRWMTSPRYVGSQRAARTFARKFPGTVLRTLRPPFSTR